MVSIDICRPINSRLFVVPVTDITELNEMRRLLWTFKAVHDQSEGITPVFRQWMRKTTKTVRLYLRFSWWWVWRGQSSVFSLPPAPAGFLLGLNLDSEDRSDMILQNTHVYFELHGITSQKTIAVIHIPVCIASNLSGIWMRCLLNTNIGPTCCLNEQQ